MEMYKTVTPNRGRGLSPEVVVYTEVPTTGLSRTDLEYFGALERKSVIVAYGRSGGCTWRLDCI